MALDVVSCGEELCQARIESAHVLVGYDTARHEFLKRGLGVVGEQGTEHLTHFASPIIEFNDIGGDGVQGHRLGLGLHSLVYFADLEELLQFVVAASANPFLEGGRKRLAREATQVRVVVLALVFEKPGGDIEFEAGGEVLNEWFAIIGFILPD